MVLYGQRIISFVPTAVMLYPHNMAGTCPQVPHPDHHGDSSLANSHPIIPHWAKPPADKNSQRKKWFPICMSICYSVSRDHFVYAPSQWETTLQCNFVCHWLGAYTKFSLWIFSWLIKGKLRIYVLVHWVTIGSDNGLLLVRCQATICINSGLLFMGPLWTNWEIWNKFNTVRHKWSGCHFADNIFNWAYILQSFFVFWFKFHRTLFLRVQLAKMLHCFGWWLELNRWQQAIS